MTGKRFESGNISWEWMKVTSSSIAVESLHHDAFLFLNLSGIIIISCILILCKWFCNVLVMKCFSFLPFKDVKNENGPEDNETTANQGEEAGTKGLQSSPVNMEGAPGEEEEEEFAFDPTTGQELLDENENDEVDDSGMEAGLESDSDEEPTQETTQPGNELVVLDPDHVSALLFFLFKNIWQTHSSKTFFACWFSLSLYCI